MGEKTLADKVRNFSRVRIKKVIVKVPKLKVRKAVLKPKNDDKIPVSFITNILIKTAVENSKKEEKKKKQLDEKGYTISKQNNPITFNGGYGTVLRYGISPHKSYVDYGKIFSYLGNFRAQSSFENFVSDSPTEKINRVAEQDNKFYLVDREVIDNGVRSIKYFTHGTITTELSAVPMGNISSADWEKFKLWKIVDYVMFNLKMSTL